MTYGLLIAGIFAGLVMLNMFTPTGRVPAEHWQLIRTMWVFRTLGLLIMLGSIGALAGLIITGH